MKIVTKPIADYIYKGYNALKLEGVKRSNLKLIQTDVSEEFGINISLKTVERYAYQTFDEVKEYRKEHHEEYNPTKRRERLKKLASNPKHFSVITNNDLSSKDMAEKTGLGEQTVNTYRSALIKEGLATRKEKRVSQEDDKILSLLKGEPLTYEEISNKTGKPQQGVGTAIRRLKRKGKVRNVRIALGGSGKSPFSSYQLIDGLTSKTIAYLPGEEKLLGEKITKYVQKGLGQYERKSLAERIKRFLPKDSFEVVHEDMIKHAIN